MQEALLEQVLEHRHLYAQNAALKHGVAGPPRRVTRSVREIVTADPAPQQPGKLYSDWKKNVLLPILIGCGLAASIIFADYLMIANEQDAGAKPQALIEWLEDSGAAP